MPVWFENHLLDAAAPGGNVVRGVAGDRSIGPASAWPQRRPYDQSITVAPVKAKLDVRVPRPGSASAASFAALRGAPAAAAAAAAAEASPARPRRPASAPARSAVRPTSAGALREAAVPERPSSALADNARQRWNDLLEARAAKARHVNPNCSAAAPAAKQRARPGSASVTAVLSEPEVALAPLPVRRTRRRPHSAAPRASKAPASPTASPAARARPASAGPSTVSRTAVGETSGSFRVRDRSESLNGSGNRWTATRLEQLAPELPPPTSPAVARLWHSLCDGGAGLRARHAGVAEPYAHASGLRESRRAEVQRSWLEQVGSGAVLQLAIARRRLAFASQLLPNGEYK